MEAGIATLSSPQVAELKYQEVKTSIRKNSRSQTGAFVKKTMDLLVIITQPVSALALKRERKKQYASVIDIKNRSQYPSAKGEERRTNQVNLHF